MFERDCELFELEKDDSESADNPKVDHSGKAAVSLGSVALRIVYDDDVYGARIVAYSHAPEEVR